MDMVASYSNLLERVGHFLFGMRSDYSADQSKDITDCIGDGLRRVYAAYDWSFFHPVKTIPTVDGKSSYDLPPGFDSIESEIHYELGEDTFYPPLSERSDSQIRHWQQHDDDKGRPLYFSTRTVEFDPAVGSRRQLILYPTPDSQYTLRARMKLRQTPIDATNQYPVGGETLAPVITAACLAAAEHNYDDNEAVHEKRFLELLPMAIAADQQRSSPRTLGPDAPHSRRLFVSDYWLRSSRIGTLTLDGDTL